MNDDASMADPLGPIVEQFTNDVRQGKRPRVEEYATRFPQFAEQLRQMLPVLAMMEKAKEETTGPTPVVVPINVVRGGTLGGYRIFREIGRGGMGVVYEAEQESLGRHVALKVLPQHMSTDPQMVQRFQREARAAAQLHHTNIVPVFEIGHDDGTYFYAMQFIRGLSLDEVLDQVRQLKTKDSNGAPVVAEVSQLSSVAHSLWTGEFSGVATHASRLDIPFIDPVELQDESAADFSPLIDNAGNWETGGGAGGLNPRDLAAQPEDRMRSKLRHATLFSASAQANSKSTRPDSSSVRLPGRGELSSVDSKFDYYARSVARVGQQVATALSYAHERGIIHRDIKPSNLLLDAAGVVWVTDFGLAKTVEDGLTRTGHMLGTLRYMAPERFHGVCDAESDIYSLGITLYEMLTLRPVFESKDRLELIRMISDAEPIRPRTIDIRIPRDLETIILKAMDKDPRHRYRSASAFAADLDNYLNDEPIWARRISLPERLWRWAKRSKGTATALSIIMLLLVLFAITATWAATHYRNMVGKQASLVEEMSLLAKEQTRMRETSEKERQQAVAAKLDAQQNLYYSQIHVAAQAWESHRGLQRMRNLLEQWRPEGASFDYRGWEWYYLAGLLNKCEQTIGVQGHIIAGASFSPTTGDIAAGNEDGIVRIWDARTGRVIYGYRAHLRDVRSVAWSPDGDLIAAGGKEGALHVHSMLQQGEIRSIQSHTADIECVAFSPDGRFLATTSTDGTTRISHAREGLEVSMLSSSSAALHALAWSPDGRRIAVAGEQGVVQIWDTESSQMQSEMSGHSRAIRSIAWSPDGKYLASAGDDQLIRLWDAATGALIRGLEGHTHAIQALNWSPDSRYLASGSYDQTIRVWDVRDDTLARIFRGHTDRINCVAWSADGTKLVSAGYDQTLRIWNPNSEIESLTYRAHHGAYSTAAAHWDPRGNRIASSAADSTVHVWDPRTADLLVKLEGHTGGVTTTVWHPKLDKLVTSGEDGTVRIWNANTGEQIQSVKKFDQPARAVSFDADGSKLAAAGESGQIVLFDAETLRETLSLRLGDSPLYALRWNPKGAEFAVGGDDHVVRVIDAQTGQTRLEFDALSAIRSLAWSPDGKQLATGGDDARARVWDVATSTLRHELAGHSDHVLSLTWSHDGDRLVSSSVDGTLRVWDVVAGAETLTLRGHRQAVGSVDWSSDGMQIVSASEDATVRVWDALPGYEGQRSEELLAILNQRITANPRNISDLEIRRGLLQFFGRHAEAQQDRATIIQLYEAQLGSGRYLAGVAERLATILMDSDDEWTPLAPGAGRSQGGSTLIPQPDHSLIVEGFNPDWDIYTLQAKLDLDQVTAVRLEAIPDSRLPGGGSGRFSANGNFHLSEIRARGILPGRPTPSELYFIRAVADFAPRDNPIENAIDTDVTTSWNVWPSQTDRHVAVFEFSEPWKVPTDQRGQLEIALEFHSKSWMSHNLGRFRLSVTSRARPVLREQLRVDLQAGRVDSRIRLAGAYYLVGDFQRAEDLLADLPPQKQDENGYALVLRALVSRELKRDNAPTFRRDAAEWLKRQDTTRGFVTPLQLPE